MGAEAGQERAKGQGRALDQEARKSYYGYKNHVGVDCNHKPICRYAESDASVHDSQMLDEVLDKSNTSNEVWTDCAYWSAETEAKLKEKGYKSRIHRCAARSAGSRSLVGFGPKQMRGLDLARPVPREDASVLASVNDEPSVTLTRHH
jgi:IS5 family transposase